MNDFWNELEAEAKAQGPEAVAELKQLAHRYRLGGEVAVLRSRAGLSQEQVADQTGIDQAEISRIERGVANPTHDTLERIAAALGVRVGFMQERAPVPASVRALLGPTRFGRSVSPR